MKVIFTIAAAILLLLVAAFCAFGFMATFEPTDRPGVFMAFRIGYAIVGGGCLFALAMLLVLRG